MSPPDLILASGSAVRRQLLEKAGLTFEIKPAAVDEESATWSLLSENAAPDNIALTLAEMKAVRVSAQRPDALVIGADSVLVCNGRLYAKPENAKMAEEHLKQLRGRTHDNICGICLAKGGTTIWRNVTTAKLTMRDFSDEFLTGFVRRNVPDILSSAGAYRLEDEGVQLFQKIDGDYFTILGLTMLPLLDILREHGIVPK